MIGAIFILIAVYVVLMFLASDAGGAFLSIIGYAVTAGFLFFISKIIGI